MMKAILLASAVCCLVPAAWGQTVKLTVAADEAPKDKAWEEPAKFSWTSDEGNESVAIDIAVKATGATGFEDSLWSAYLVAHTNDNEKKLQESYKAGVGFNYDISLGPDVGPDGQIMPDTPTLVTNTGVAFQRKAVYIDTPPPPCTGNPSLAFCDTQHEESLQLTLDLALSVSWLEKPVFFNGKTDKGVSVPENLPPFIYAISPSLMLFHDETVSAVVNPTTGLKADGGVSGARAKISAAVTPRWLDYRLTLRASVQQVEAFDRADSRQALFAKSSTLSSASLDYNFAGASFDKSPGWKPSIGISYSSGADPLSGRADKEQTVVAFKLAYSPG